MASATRAAPITITGQRLRVTRSGIARWLGGSVDVPVDHVVSAAAADRRDARRLWMGIRVAGIQLPGVMTAGIFRRDGELSWWDVRRGIGAIVLTLRDERFARVVVEVDDPTDTLRWLDEALSSTSAPGAGR
jgi:hypothetical protein